MANGRELPEEERTRRTSGENPTRVPPGVAQGPLAGETVIRDATRPWTDVPSGKHDGAPTGPSGKEQGAPKGPARKDEDPSGKEQGAPKGPARKDEAPSTGPSGKHDGAPTGGTQAMHSAAGSGEQKAAAAHDDQSTVLFGKYLVLRKLGEGAMGEVWLVRHRELGVERALKLIKLSQFSNPEMRARARREARAMALFSHPNAVTVHDANADGDLAYIEMEYIRGRSLNRVLQPETPMPLAWVAEMVQQLCAVLEVAHAHGIVHRDLKPSNMMLVGEEPQEHEHLKILDFGIAKILHAEDQGGEDVKTSMGAIIGTPAYISPEQINTEAGQLDGRSDLYTVGVILFEMLTGRRPFTTTAFRLTYDHLYTAPPTFSEVNPDHNVPAEVEQLVRRCLEKDPKLRPRSARELADEFRRITKPPESVVEPERPAPRRWGSLAIAGLLVALTIVVGLLVYRRPFTIRASRGDVTLRAGEEIRLTIIPEGFGASRASVIPPKTTHKGLQITREGVESGPGVGEFKVSARPNATQGPVVLAFVGKLGGLERTARVKLTITPPDFSVPKGFAAAEGSEPVGDNGKFYHSAIVRDLGGGQKAEFLYIKKKRSGEPDSFYMMRDKVSNGLFALFVRAKPELFKKTQWKSGGKKGERLPAMHVNAGEAYRFAEWLGGGKVRVRLPSTEQWDKAAGYYDEKRVGKGPFKPDWKPGEIALDRAEPVEVGTSRSDVSPYGCRDMAGNGMEWTRNAMARGVVLPLPPEDEFTTIMLRGNTFGATTPFHYEWIDDQNLWMAHLWYTSEPDIGFRVVIEDP